MYYQDLLEQSYLKLTTKEHRKTFAQFFTPPAIAELMAAYILDNPSCKQVLDPAAGLSIFASALEENLRYLNTSQLQNQSAIYGIQLWPCLYSPLENSSHHEHHAYSSILNRSLRLISAYNVKRAMRPHLCNYLGLLAYNSHEADQYFKLNFGRKDLWERGIEEHLLNPRSTNFKLDTDKANLNFSYEHYYDEHQYTIVAPELACGSASAQGSATKDNTLDRQPSQDTFFEHDLSNTQLSLVLGKMEHGARQIELVGYELDPIILEFNRFFLAHNPFAHVHYDLRHKDYLKANFKERYDGIICNPPYLMFKEFAQQSKSIAQIEERLGIDLPKRINLYALFLLKSLSQLKPRGRCAYLIPYEFLNSSFGIKLKEQFLKQRNLAYVITFNLKGPIFDNATTTCGLFLFNNAKVQEQVEFITVHSLDELELLTLRLCPNLFTQAKNKELLSTQGILLSTRKPKGHAQAASQTQLNRSTSEHPDKMMAELPLGACATGGSTAGDTTHSLMGTSEQEHEATYKASAFSAATAADADGSDGSRSGNGECDTPNSQASGSLGGDSSSDSSYSCSDSACYHAPKEAEQMALLQRIPGLISCLSAINVLLPEQKLTAEDERKTAATMAYLEQQGKFVPSMTLPPDFQDLVIRLSEHESSLHSEAKPTSTAAMHTAPLLSQEQSATTEDNPNAQHLILSYASICPEDTPQQGKGRDNIMIRGRAVPYIQLNAKKKWHIYYQERLLTEHLQTQTGLSMDKLSTFDRFIKVKRGLATGANEFFLFNRTKKEQLQLKDEFFVPVIPRANLVSLPILTTQHFNKLAADNASVFLLNAPDVVTDPTLQRYLDSGVKQNIHRRYLTRHRSPWYALERREVAPIFMSVFNRGTINVVRNEAQIYNLTTFHSIFVLDESQTDLIFAYLLTPLAKDIILQNRREYGGGLEKLEPLDINHAACVNFNALSAEQIKAILELYQRYRALILGEGEFAGLKANEREHQAAALINKISQAFTELLRI